MSDRLLRHATVCVDAEDMNFESGDVDDVVVKIDLSFLGSVGDGVFVG